MNFLYILQKAIYFADEKKIDSENIYYDSDGESFVRDRSEEELSKLMKKSKIELFTEDEWVEENRQEFFTEEKLYKMGLMEKDWIDEGVFLSQIDAHKYYTQNKHHYPKEINVNILPVQPIGTLDTLINTFLCSSQIIENTLQKKRGDIYKEEITRDPIFLLQTKKKILTYTHYKTIGIAITREEGEKYLADNHILNSSVFCHCANSNLAKLLKEFFKD